MDVKEWRDEIVFLHKVKPGAADRSYGIQVAKLAGLPKPVTARAAEVLALLEKSEQGARRRGAAERFAAVRRRPADIVRARERRQVGHRGGAGHGAPRRADAEGRAGGALPAQGAGAQGSRLNGCVGLKPAQMRRFLRATLWRVPGCSPRHRPARATWWPRPLVGLCLRAPDCRLFLSRRESLKRRVTPSKPSRTMSPLLPCFIRGDAWPSLSLHLHCRPIKKSEFRLSRSPKKT